MRQGPILTPAETSYREARALLAYAMAADHITPEHLANCHAYYQAALDTLQAEEDALNARTA